MEVQSKLSPRLFWVAVIGLLTLVLVGLLIFLGISLLSPRKASAPTPVVAAATIQATANPAQPAPTAARTQVLDIPTATPVPPTPISPTAARPTNPPAPAQQPKPGVYVTRLTMDKTRLASNEEPIFYATFVNTTGSPVDSKWFVYIYREGAVKPMGQTNAQKMYIPTGTNVLPAQNWHANVKGVCEPYYAQVVYDDGGPKPFRTTEGKIASVSFNVCK